MKQWFAMKRVVLFIAERGPGPRDGRYIVCCLYFPFLAQLYGRSATG